MDKTFKIKLEQDNEKDIEFDIVPVSELVEKKYNYENDDDIDNIEQLIEQKQAIIDEYNEEINRLTNNADKLDYTVAVACGVLTGALDVFFVGEFDFEGSVEKVNEKFSEFVTKKADEIKNKECENKIKDAIDKAKEKGEISEEKAKQIAEKIKESYKKKMDNESLSNKIKTLEKTFGIPSDDSWQSGKYGIDAKSHHLDDLAHHPTVIGLAASILTQFTKKAYFQNKNGDNLKLGITEVRVIDNIYAYIKHGSTRVIDKNGKKALEVTLVGETVKEKFACGIFNWIGHLISDMAGSHNSAAAAKFGMGLPGPIIATLKEIAMLPIIRKTPLPELLHKLFTSDNLLFGKYRLDLRSELALGRELGRQAIPVFINEILVRLFYFIRRFINEAKKAETFAAINWTNTLPWKNRTVIRMLTISMGTFEVIDLGDAAIRGAVNSGGTLAGFFTQFVLRINFVGIGRFAIAIGTDAYMGAKRQSYINKRITANSEINYLYGAKIFYLQENMWIEAKNTTESIQKMEEALDNAVIYYRDANQEIKDNMVIITDKMNMIAEYNVPLKNDLMRKLRR